MTWFVLYTALSRRLQEHQKREAEAPLKELAVLGTMSGMPRWRWNTTMARPAQPLAVAQ